MTDYRRLTEEHINDAKFCSGCSFDDDLNGCEIGGCDKYYMYFETYERLKKLEDMIESGELISTKEVGDTEIEFFVKHNESVRKNTATDIFSWVYKNLVNLNFIAGNVEINLSALNNFAKTYGVDVFDIFKQGGK